MSTKTKKKLCWNCEGGVTFQDELCPYCGVSLDVSPIAGTNLGQIHFDPPYKLSSTQDSEIPPAPYGTIQKEDGQTENAESEEVENGEIKNVALPLSLALLGTVLTLFGLILFIFSDNRGILTLNWNGVYWYAYLMIGLPLLYLGWRLAQSYQDN